MELHQTNTLNMFDATEQLMSSNSTLWNSNPAIATAYNVFTSHVSAINTSDLAQKTSTKGITSSKAQAKTAMINATLVLANAGKAYASVTNNVVLLDNLQHGKNEILKATDTDADDICQNIHDAINPVITNLAPYGANAASLTAQQTAIATFSALIGKPRATKSISVNATLTISQHFDAGTIILKNQIDPLIEQYQNTNAAFYNEYKAVRVIQEIGHRHTVMLDGFVYNVAHVVIPGATVTLSGNASHQKITDASGAYKFTRLHTGNYSITVSAPGFVTQTIPVVVSQNGNVENDFVMIVG